METRHIEVNHYMLISAIIFLLYKAETMQLYVVKTIPNTTSKY